VAVGSECIDIPVPLSRSFICLRVHMRSIVGLVISSWVVLRFELVYCPLSLAILLKKSITLLAGPLLPT
jgi:hypothetical protein